MSYLTFTSHIDANADRHFANGLAYLEGGNAEYAAGSFRKAAKNRTAAKRFRGVFEPPPAKTPLERLLRDSMDRLAAKVSADMEGLLYG